MSIYVFYYFPNQGMYIDADEAATTTQHEIIYQLFPLFKLNLDQKK